MKQLEPGDVVGDRFVVERLAGEGGAGRVYRAFDRTRHAAVALKVWNDRAAVNEREARTLLELVHPSIVRCVAFGGDYLATEWIEGETLRDRLGRKEEPISIGETLAIARRVAEGLGAAHAWGIVHRDITPANIMMVRPTSPGHDLVIKLLDFGLAARGRTTQAAGTVGYAAPEQARGEPPSPRADVFSLGCVLCECLLGEKPFGGDTDVAVMASMLDGDTARVTARLDHVPLPLVRLLARMLASDPQARPSDGAAVAAELALLSVAPLPARSRGSVTGAEARGAQVLVAEVDASVAPRLVAELAELGGRVSMGDLLVCMFPSGASAVESAVRGARAALAVRRSTPRARASLVVAPSDEAGVRAARESLPESPSVRVDADTARLLGDRFVVRHDGDDLVLLREGTTSSSRTSLLGRETKCVGRDREIGLIASVFEECKEDGVARIVWLLGAPGIGKTRVRDEVLLRIVHDDPAAVRVWSAHADPTRAGVPFGVMADLVRSAAAVSADDASDYQRLALASRACAFVPPEDAARVVEFLSELLRLEVADPSGQLRAAREEPMLMADQVQRALDDLSLSELVRQPLVVIVEDLQWADVASIRALSEIARRAAERPLFVLLVGRPEAKDTLLRLVADRQPVGVSLGKLSSRAMDKLVSDALGCEPADPRVASIAERAGGNPFFAEELVRAGDDASGPTAALAMLEARLAGLEPEARRVLRAASVIGQRFMASEVAPLLGDASPEFVDAWCTWLAEREVLARADAAWAFRQSLVRDAAYAMIPEPDRAVAHAFTAERLEREHGRGPVIAQHWARAGEPAKAARWLASSAGEALEANDLGACIELGERALGSLEDARARGTLLVVLAEAHRWRGDYARAAERAREALTFAKEGDARYFRAAAELASSTGSRGPVAEFEAAVDLLTRAPDQRSDAASIAWSRAAMQLLVRGDARADAMLERARDAAVSDLAIGRVEQTYAIRAGMRGELEDLVRRYEAAVNALARAGDVRGACLQELNLASALCELGQDERARGHIARGRTEAQARGLAAALALANHLDGILFAREGRLDEAISAQKLAVTTFAAQGNARMEGGARCHLAELLTKAADLPAALDEASRAEKLLVAVPPARARALAALAAVHIARKDAQAALAASAEALAIAETAGVETGEPLVYEARADALALVAAPEAEQVRERGRAKLHARAEAIHDPALRRSFLAVANDTPS